MTFSFARTADDLRLPLAPADGDGLRHAQIAAAHAIALHFWAAPSRPALVVMPTGSGKTAVMILASLLLRPSRVLVIAPSRLLRDQLVEKFAALAPLREVGALAIDAECPTVTPQDGRVTDESGWEALRSAHVVVTLPHSSSPGIAEVVSPPADLFDLVLVDEAHHAPAPIYRALMDAFPAARKVLFTATPFRRDEQEVPGDVVFTYHLRQAREDGVFGRLRYVPVNVPGESTQPERDEAVARAAAMKLIQDREAGLDHRILIRASSRERADELLDVYKKATALDLRRVHSGLSQKFVSGVIDDLRAGTIDGVIAVDMLGEGFDLPQLKVAALHARHRSLAITLQFIGRFARTSKEKNLGEATFFAVPDEIKKDAEDLYVPGAEWNEIVETLSREQIEGEKDAREFARTFALTAPEDGEDEEDDDNREYDELSEEDAWRLLRTLNPYFHVKVYDALATPKLNAPLVVPPGLTPLMTRHSKKHEAVVWIGRQRGVAPWTTHEEWIDVQHELFMLVHVPSEKLLFVFASRRHNSVYDGLVTSVLGDQHRRLPTNEVNRVLHGIVGPEFFSVGMRNRAGAGGGGAESYRMLAGRSADRALRAADGKTYNQGHGFCRGVENGEAVTIGYSSSSKVWANRYGSIDEFVAWMRMIAVKLRRQDALVTGSGIDNLPVARRIAQFGHSVVHADLPHSVYESGGLFVRANGTESAFHDLSVVVTAQTATTVDFSLTGVGIALPFGLSLGRTPLIAPSTAASRAATARHGAEGDDEPLADYLNEHRPVFYLENLARVDGDEQQDPPGRTVPEPIVRQITGVDWSKQGVDPFLEKPPATKKGRSLFEYVEQLLLGSSAKVVFLDDGAGEIADYVAVEDIGGKVVVQLFHCKAAGGTSVPNQRIADLYEVVGQAVKCRRYLDCRRLAEQLAHRVTLTRSKFCRGNLSDVSSLLKDPSRVLFQVVVVQPSIGTDPSEAICRLLEAADAYLRGGDQSPLVFWGTAAT